MLDRRAFLRSSVQLTLLAPWARLSLAAPNADARLVLVILRGGLDGLAAIPPYGESRYRSLRAELALDSPGTGGGILKLDGLFGMHPALAGMHDLFLQSELSVVHAAATPYRERSHFDGQNMLEGGGDAPRAVSDGWLNRALTELRAAGSDQRAVALAQSVPLVLRGPFIVSGWTPSRFPDAEEETLARVRAMYAAVDPALSERLGEALKARDIAGVAGMGSDRRPGQQLAALITAAGRFLSTADGPRIAVLEAGGWDTHANQGAGQGILAARLRGLDASIGQLKSELGEHWQRTAVMVVTEFGRTVAANGTRGTDHGTAGCAFITGGAVNGGRVIADWPGLGQRDLHEGRDLRATLDLRSVFKGLLAEHFGLSEAALERTVFPGSESAAVLDGLIKA